MKVVKVEGEAALVENDGEEGWERRIVPNRILNNGIVEKEEFDRGITYGLPWEDLLTPQVTPEVIANALRQRGIWTLEDVRRNPGKVLAALQSAYRLDFVAILAAAESASVPRGE